MGVFILFEKDEGSDIRILESIAEFFNLILRIERDEGCSDFCRGELDDDPFGNTGGPEGEVVPSSHS